MIDRLNEFKSENSFSGSKSSQRRGGSGSVLAGHKVVSHVELTRDITSDSIISISGDVRLFDTIDESITRIENAGRRINRLTDIKRSGLPNAQRNAQKETDDLVSQIRPQIQNCKGLLEQAKRNEETKEKSLHKAFDAQWSTNMINSLTRRFQNSIISFQNSTQRFTNVIKEDFTRQAKIVNPQITQLQVQEMLESTNPSKYLEQNIMKLNYDILDEINELENEHKRVRKLEIAINEIQELFNACALLVSEAQDQLDQIEHNVNETKVEIEKGREQIFKAEGYKKMSRKTNLKTTFCCFIVIGILVFILLWTLGVFKT